jgi:hypothetical protein
MGKRDCVSAFAPHKARIDGGPSTAFLTDMIMFSQLRKHGARHGNDKAGAKIDEWDRHPECYQGLTSGGFQ